jgi:[ribosomal protein S5]-alanine N-acetyltransferase
VKRLEHRSRRLVLRALKNSDYHAWYDAWVNRLPAQSFWDEGPMPKRKCTRVWFLKMKKRLQDFASKDEYYRYEIVRKKDGAIIGHIDFDIHKRGPIQSANFGYVIYNRFWQQGYGQEAARLGLKIGFVELKLNRLEAAINLDNKKSIRLAKLIGMRREGVRKRYWFENDQWVDHLIYAANPKDVGLKGVKV